MEPEGRRRWSWLRVALVVALLLGITATAWLIYRPDGATATFCMGVGLIENGVHPSADAALANWLATSPGEPQSGWTEIDSSFDADGSVAFAPPPGQPTKYQSVHLRETPGGWMADGACVAA